MYIIKCYLIVKCLDIFFVLTDLYWKNPQFFITIEDIDKTDNRGLATLIVTLTEKEANNKSTVAIGFDIYKVIEITRYYW